MPRPDVPVSMVPGRGSLPRLPLDRRTSVLAALGTGSVAALLGVAHALSTTQGSVLGYALVAFVFLSLFGVTAFLLVRVALVTPALALAALVFRVLLFSPIPPPVDGPYPGLVVAWPVVLGVLLVVAGGEWLVRELLLRSVIPRLPMG